MRYGPLSAFGWLRFRILPHMANPVRSWAVMAVIVGWMQIPCTLLLSATLVTYAGRINTCPLKLFMCRFIEFAGQLLLGVNQFLICISITEPTKIEHELCTTANICPPIPDEVEFQQIYQMISGIRERTDALTAPPSRAYESEDLARYVTLADRSSKPPASPQNQPGTLAALLPAASAADDFGVPAPI